MVSECVIEFVDSKGNKLFPQSIDMDADHIKVILELDELGSLSKSQIDTLMYAVERLIDYGGNVDSMREYLELYDFLEKLRGRK